MSDNNKDSNLRLRAYVVSLTVNPFTTDPVKALRFAILV